MAKSKYRDEKILPTNLIRLDNTERRFLAGRLIQQIKSKDRLKREAAGLLALQYSLGISHDQAYQLNVEENFSSCLTKYRLTLPLGDQQWNPKQTDLALFEAKFTEIELPLIMPLVKWLKSVLKKHSGGILKECIDGSEKQIKYQSKLFFEELRRECSAHITHTRLSSALKAETYCKYQNPVIAYLLLNKTDLQPNHTRYYYVPSNHELFSAWLCIQEQLWGDDDLAKSTFNEELKWNGWAIKRVFVNNFIQSISQLPDQSDLISFHNGYTKYIVSMLVWNLGHRSVKDPFCEISKLCMQSKRVLILDKYKNGRENLRLLPLPAIVHKQLDYYFAHLKNVANRLAFCTVQYPNSTSLRQYFQQLVAGKNESTNRLFFLIDEKKNTLKPITRGVLKGWFHREGLSVSPNFGRHYMATRMMADTPVNYETTQYYLGHSLRKKTRPISELIMGKLVGELDGHIDQIMRDDGWQALKGYRYRRAELVEAKAHRAISPSFFPNESPGFFQRAENQKHQVIRIERLTAEISSYLNQATKQGGESDEVMFKRDFEYESELKEKIKSLNFPYHPKWSELKTFIREEFDNYNPLPDVLKFQNLSSGVSCLSSRTLNKSRLSQARVSSWVEWANKCLLAYLNPKDPMLRAVRIRSALIVNSALLGGAHRPAILHALAGHKLDSLLYDFEYFQTDSVSHVEIYVTDTYEEDGEKFEDRSWLDRWIPDPLSCILLSQSDQLLDKSDVLTEVKSLLSKSGVDISHKAVLKKLAKCSNGINLESREFFRDSIGTGRFASRPQSLNSWARHLTGGSLLEKRVEEAVVLGSIETAAPLGKPLVESSGGLKPALEVLKKKLRVIGKNATAIVGATRLQRCRYIETQLDELQASTAGLPFAITMFLEWAQFLSLRGTKGYTRHGKVRLKAATIIKYANGVLQSVFIDSLVDGDIEHFPNFEQMSEREITDLFKRILKKRANTSYAIEIKRTLYMFHSFIRDTHGLSNCDWDELDGVPLKYSPPRSGDIISESEYIRVLSSMAQELDHNELMSGMSTMFVAIIMFRFGLRPSEAFKLMPSELVFHESGELTSLLIRKNYLNDTKTKKSVRKVPSTHELTSIEYWVIRYLQERAAAYSEIQPYFALTDQSIDIESRYLFSQRMSEAAASIGRHIKSVTGDNRLGSYVLRHSYITHQVANTISVDDYDSHLQSRYLKSSANTFVENEYQTLKLESLSVAVGHKSLATTLKTYSHCLELIHTSNWSAQNQLDDMIYASLLGKSIQAYQTQKHRLGGHRFVVESYLAKINLPSLASLCRKPKSFKYFDLNNARIDKPSLRYLSEMILIKSKRMTFSNSSIYNSEAFEKIAIAINQIQLSTSVTEVLNLFGSAKNKHIARLFRFLEANTSELDHKLKSIPFRRKLKAQIELWLKARKPTSKKWVVLNENEAKSLIAMMASLNVPVSIVNRQSSYEENCASKSVNVRHFNHSANVSHSDVKRKKSGYELVLEISDELKNIKTLDLFLVIVLILLSN